MDNTTYGDALNVLERYGSYEKNARRGSAGAKARICQRRRNSQKSHELRTSVVVCAAFDTRLGRILSAGSSWALLTDAVTPMSVVVMLLTTFCTSLSVSFVTPFISVFVLFVLLSGRV